MIIPTIRRPARVASVLAVLFTVWLFLFAHSFPGYQLPTDLLQRTANHRPAFWSSTKKAGSGATSRIAKVTVAANKLDSDVIHRALLTHERHNALHGYQHHIAYQEAVSGLIENDRQRRPRGAWTKPAYLLSILVSELQKPEEERLEWVFWFDADTVIMNYETPLEIFLPPANATGVENVDLVITSNWDGLNSGVFALRVNHWSVSFLSAVLAYPIYRSDRLATDRFRDQSAFQFLLQNKTHSPLATAPMRSKDHWVEVPMRWFNSLPVNNAFYKNGTWLFGKNMTSAMFDNGTTKVFDDGHGGAARPWKIMQGDMVVHFAGTSHVRDSWMEPWVERSEAALPQWNNATHLIPLKEQISEFWAKTDEQMEAERKKYAAEEEKRKKEQKEKDKLEQEKKATEKAKKEKEEKDKKEKERVEKEKLKKEKKEKVLLDAKKKELQEKQQEHAKLDDEERSAGEVLLVDTSFAKTDAQPSEAKTPAAKEETEVAREEAAAAAPPVPRFALSNQTTPATPLQRR
ncbi:galactosyl transferase gma12 mnn10 family protein [Podospora didyma]|uniref:Galactosyl transferase gma12 mnn10 family protein n=1 Tax=Podospora didyma TaxID=330526 RepID=A0AAE0U7Z9_9PEZI|nr:galactosyl transferase gma12 mnn10 family protein [Podospora didyma]